MEVGGRGTKKMEMKEKVPLGKSRCPKRRRRRKWKRRKGRRRRKIEEEEEKEKENKLESKERKEVCLYCKLVAETRKSGIRFYSRPKGILCALCLLCRLLVSVSPCPHSLSVFFYFLSFCPTVCVSLYVCIIVRLSV